MKISFLPFQIEISLQLIEQCSHSLYKPSSWIKFLIELYYNHTTTLSIEIYIVVHLDKKHSLGIKGWQCHIQISTIFNIL